MSAGQLFNVPAKKPSGTVQIFFRGVDCCVQSHAVDQSDKKVCFLSRIYRGRSALDEVGKFVCPGLVACVVFNGEGFVDGCGAPERNPDFPFAQAFLIGRQHFFCKVQELCFVVGIVRNA